MSQSKKKILQRIEPWIQRELQAILQDPDPTIIVHVATSLYLSRFHMTGDLSTAIDNDDGFLDPLRRFLGEWTDMFWHELRYAVFVHLFISPFVFAILISYFCCTI